MIYGLYLSAQGVLANSYRQDVIANNLANAETVGFKRDLTIFQQQRTEAQKRGVNPGQSNRLLESMGGGLGVAPTFVDVSPGELEQTGSPLDTAIQGQGFYVVQNGKETRLTRDGRFLIDRQGYLTRASGGQHVLDAQLKPIRLDPTQPIRIDGSGQISQRAKVVAKLAVVDAPDPLKLTKHADLMMSYPDINKLKAGSGTIHSGYVERSNVDPANELVSLMDAQRQLEANANMIRYQDQMLARLVNDVGRIS